ncbi:hypothetical protein E2C01_010099 [Portunus trituberculatus]|uniref:Uncharacterized protein n=1 Tax=Portunus trituberculatus TaxID=210409 RepID=A0A5B7D7I1_PORTR|nr:hypothetical protein [Portunus trituberculatus]
MGYYSLSHHHNLFLVPSTQENPSKPHEYDIRVVVGGVTKLSALHIRQASESRALGGEASRTTPIYVVLLTTLWFSRSVG